MGKELVTCKSIFYFSGSMLLPTCRAPPSSNSDTPQKWFKNVFQTIWEKNLWKQFFRLRKKFWISFFSEVRMLGNCPVQGQAPQGQVSLGQVRLDVSWVQTVPKNDFVPKFFGSFCTKKSFKTFFGGCPNFRRGGTSMSVPSKQLAMYCICVSEAQRKEPIEWVMTLKLLKK